MRNYLWCLLLIACCLNLGSVKAKPLVSFGIGVQTSRPYAAPYTDPYYNNYYGYNGYYGGNGGYPSGRYPSSYPYSPSYYPGPYSPGYRYGAGGVGGSLDFGIGALSLTPFLL